MPRQKKTTTKIEKSSPSKKLIIEFLGEMGGVSSEVEIAKKFGLSERSYRKELKKKIFSLERKGLIQVQDRKIYLIQKGDKFLEGIVSAHPRGFAFLVTGEGEQDVFLPPREARKVLNGDRALVRLISQRKKDKVYGRIVKVLDIHHRVIVGRYVNDQFDRQQFIPIGNGLKTPIRLRKPARPERVKNGQLVSVEVQRDFNGIVTSMDKIRENFGNFSDKGMPQTLAMVNNLIRSGWNEEINKEILEFEIREGIESIGVRRDLRSYPFITIDGKDAKDFDDAVYAEKTTEGYLLFVAIADVSFYVKSGSSIDREAFERGNSVYFSQSVVPMLPEKLSNDLCSLLPNEDRLVLVVSLQVDNFGSMKAVQFSEGVINSKRRFTYDEVQSIYDEESKQLDVIEGVIESLFNLKEIYHSLSNARSARNALNIDGPEIRYKFNKDSRLKSIQLAPRLDSQKVIEECMIAANVAAADFCGESQMLYRHHPRPDPDKLEELRQEAKKIGLKTNESIDGAVSICNDILKFGEKRKERLLLESMVMRSQKLASYSSSEKSHFGLALPYYTHFTSPIRRYSDLIVHRLIKEKIQNPLYKNDGGLNVESVAIQCSSCERRAEEATREEMAYLKCEFMSRHVGDTFRAIVVSVFDLGVYAQILSNAVEGFIPIERQFAVDLNDKDLPALFSLGQHILIEVDEVDILARKIYFNLVPGSVSSAEERK